MRTLVASALLLLAVSGGAYAESSLLDPLNILGFMRQQFEPRETYQSEPRYEPREQYQPAPRYQQREEDDQQDQELVRQAVDYPGLPAGAIVISTALRRLYFGLGGGRAIQYAIGVGRDGFRWGGMQKITAKKEWPSWTPPPEMLERRPDLPSFMAGGPSNPLGARALYLGSTLYRVHGSNEPETIGQAVSSGCFRMTNKDVIDLYNRVQIGTPVYVFQNR
ncbi:MAG: L,D-transpeptidase [bacterium]|nr:L,D-transpeptidase [bacterium]